ncbi:hypothetical protein C8J57DRAFT_1459609 [Mycena rebaudengoi]|nr:hypothetical protein C8J57DRAFT_1459609 [Mycena rebaudengoi]
MGSGINEMMSEISSAISCLDLCKSRSQNNPQCCGPRYRAPPPTDCPTFLSIGPIHSIPVPPAAHSELWAQIWPWVEFIFTYSNSLPNLRSEYTISSTILEFLAQTQLKWGARLVKSTPRVRVLVASAWVQFTERGDVDGLNNLAHFIFRDTRTDAYLQLAVAIQPLTAPKIFLLFAGAKFLHDVADPAANAGTCTPFKSALLKHGVAAALPSAICTLNAMISAHSIVPELLDNLLSLLVTVPSRGASQFTRHVFLRARAHSDSLASKSDIFAQELLLLTYAPNKPFFTSFDYSRGRVSIHVNPIPTLLEVTESARWKDLAARAERSAGRLDLQWVAVREGPESRARLFRMRSAHGYIHSELVALARTLSLAEDLTQIAAKLSSAAATAIFDIDVLMAH